MALDYRSLWLSDMQLGTPSCRAEELLGFIANINAERINLVGDIIDLQRMTSRPLFPDLHLRVVAEFARLAAAGTEVLYIPGNHDHEFRRFAGRNLAGIPVMLEAAHERQNGERQLVTHGDLLDGQARSNTGLERFGAASYRFLTETDVLLNRWRRVRGGEYLSLSREREHCRHARSLAARQLQSDYERLTEIRRGIKRKLSPDAPAFP